MTNQNARKSGTSQLSQLGARDAAREIYRATHTGKRARRFLIVAVKKNATGGTQ